MKFRRYALLANSKLIEGRPEFDIARLLKALVL
jgi:hypothetical protein